MVHLHFEINSIVKEFSSTTGSNEPSVDVLFCKLTPTYLMGGQHQHLCQKSLICRENCVFIHPEK